jgi:endonuclease/exonuclease/phosphatase family metal-dependent hydrolase
MAMISVLSYNVYFGKRLEKILYWIHTQPSFDLICFQEFPKDAIPVCRKMFGSNYGFRFAPFIKKRKREYGELTIYWKKHLQLVTSSILRLGSNSGERVVLRSRMPRTSVLTIFRYKQKKIAVVNIHLVNVAFNALRYQQIMRIIKRIAKYTIASVLLGDFNMSSLFGRRKLFSLMEQSGYQGMNKRFSTHHVAVIHQQMDYIFWKQCSINNVTIHRKVRHSDHFPLTCRVENIA